MQTHRWPSRTLTRPPGNPALPATTTRTRSAAAAAAASPALLVLAEEEPASAMSRRSSPLEHRTPSQTACVRRDRKEERYGKRGGQRRGGRALSAAPIYTSAAAPASSPRPAVPALPLQIAGFANRSPRLRAQGPKRKYEEPHGGLFTRLLCLPKSAVAPTNCGG